MRDPHALSGYLTETIDLFGGSTDVVFASHHWPTCGQERVVEYLGIQRDLYAYLQASAIAEHHPPRERARCATRVGGRWGRRG